MNRFTRWGAALVLLPLAACADNTPAPAPAPPPAPPPMAAADAAFVTTAAQGNLAEISDAQLAESKAHSARVKSFAEKIMSDHQAAEDQLKQIAATKNVTLPTQPSDAQMAMSQVLQGRNGYAFDHTYIKDQITDHQAAIQAYQTEADSGTDPELKKYAADTLPILQQHLQMAEALQGHSRMRHPHWNHKVVTPGSN